MELNKLIERINFLYKKSKEQELTLDEIEEQKRLREEYINKIKLNIKSQLMTNTKIPYYDTGTEGEN